MKREEVYKLIDGERKYQDDQWPSREQAEQAARGIGAEGGSNELSIGDFILLLEEYTAKARTAWTKELRPETEALVNLRKCAGIAVNCLEQHGAPAREQ